MAVGPTPFKGVFTTVVTGGTAVPVFFGPFDYDAFIQNPATASEPLYFNYVTKPGLTNNDTTYAIYPGGTAIFPAHTNSVAYINAATSGHTFSAVFFADQTFPPTPVQAGSFPPTGPTSLTVTLPSYLYKQYDDDDNLAAFVMSYNEYTQAYVDWFNDVNLPIYTQLEGGLLDWVAEGLYGIYRPVLTSNMFKIIGPLNTWPLNTIALNTIKRSGNDNSQATSDDVFKRIITWHFYKGDGKYLTVRWLKRRVYRFLYGVNGTNAVGPTYQISITFGANNEMTITILSGIRRFIGGTILNGFYLNQPKRPLNGAITTFMAYTLPVYANIFKEAVDSGVLEMPAQFIVNVNV